MARHESNREDLLREATALVERIELLPRVAGTFTSANVAAGETIVAGFRAVGALSVFFGSDPVYQFNAAGELRRAYWNGLLFKAMRGRLVSLQRVRREHEVQLVRHELTDAEQATFLSKVSACMRELTNSLAANAMEVAGQVPQDADVLGRLQAWLADHQEWPIAARPNA